MDARDPAGREFGGGRGARPTPPLTVNRNTTARQPIDCRDREAPGRVRGVGVVNPSPGVAANVSGVIPGSVVHNRPTHELRSWIVRIPVVVEEVRQGEAPRCNRVTVHRALASQLVFFAFHRLLLAAESQIERNLVACQHKSLVVTTYSA